MSNVIEFPRGAAVNATGNAARAHVGAAFLAEPAAHSHAVQFYEEESFLYDTVAQFLAAGLKAGDRMVVIATEPHRDGFMERLEVHGAAQAIESGQLMMLDARETLAKFMVGDMPDADLFHDVLGRVITKLQGADGKRARIRAYGEMVDLLWRDGNPSAAIRLEELWNDAGQQHSFSLLCAYVMGHFYKEGEASRFMEVCRTHSHVMPTESFVELDDPHARLREIALLQQRAKSLENEVLHRKELELALRDALRERGRAEDELRACVKREQEARAKAEESDQFKEIFIGILGHDLRNPLNTILMTSNLMTMRRELSQDAQTRINRITTSGHRMQRMITQILDVTSARLAGGIPVAPKTQDLVPVVKKIVDEIAAAHPSRKIEFRCVGPCIVSIDADRIEQVVSNLVGNAVAHGDPDKPVEVDVGTRPGVASLRVTNQGAPIDPEFMPMLFDPFKRGGKPEARSQGLGLGLYISERIMSAHDGKIDVESSRETGTSFEAIFPQRRCARRKRGQTNACSSSTTRRARARRFAKSSRWAAAKRSRRRTAPKR